MPAISFPTSATRQNYTVNPFTDGNGKKWVWSVAKSRWSPVSATGAGATNLTATASAVGVNINSDTGTDASILPATATLAGLFLPAEKLKLANLALSGFGPPELAAISVTNALTVDEESFPSPIQHAGDQGGRPHWDAGSYLVYYSNGKWYVYGENNDGTQTYGASLTSTALSPIGLTGWTVNIGSYEPVIVSELPASHFGQQYLDTLSEKWYRWNGTGWDADKVLTVDSSTGGNGAADAGKLVKFGSTGGVLTATVNKVTITQPANGATLTIADGYGITVGENGSITTGYSGNIETGVNGYIQTSDGAHINAGGHIETSAVGYIKTHGTSGTGGYIDTRDGGYIDTTAGGFLKTGTGNLTGPNISGTIALTSDIVSSTGGNGTADAGKLVKFNSTGNIYASGLSSFEEIISPQIWVGTDNGNIFTDANNARIYTTGTNSHIITVDPTSYIQSRATFKLSNGTHTTTLSHAPTTNRAIAFPNADGTIALINPSSGTQTFSGAQIFDSTTRPTSSGTGTPASNSLITLADVQSFRLINLLRQITPDFSSPGSVSANGGTWDASGAVVRSRSGTTGAGANSISKSFPLTVGASGAGGINFNLPIEFHTAWFLASGGRITEAKYYLCFGRTHNAGSAPAPMTDPDKHTIGLVIDNGAVKLITHNGTTLTTSATLWTITDPLRVYYTRIRSDGAGNVSLFVDFSDTAITTITGGPTTTSAAGWMVFSCQQTTTNLPTTQAQLLINACHVLLNP